MLPENLLSRATRFSFLPEGGSLNTNKDHYFEVTVERRKDKWCVASMGAVWSNTYQEWVGDRLEPGYTHDTRFTLDEAVSLAERLIREEKFNCGMTWGTWKNSPERKLANG